MPSPSTPTRPLAPHSHRSGGSTGPWQEAQDQVGFAVQRPRELAAGHAGFKGSIGQGLFFERGLELQA
jgi:hypothetical protein